MSYKITFSDVAKKDLDQITGDIYNTCLDKSTTTEYVKGLIAKMYSKKDFPQSGLPLQFENIITDYRYVIYKSYLVFYRIETGKIVVHRILFARSDYCKYLFIENN